MPIAGPVIRYLVLLFAIRVSLLMPMAPQATSATAEDYGRQPETGPLDAPQLRPVQPSLIPSAPLSQPIGFKRTRPQDSEDEGKAGTEADELEDVRRPKKPRKLFPSDLLEQIVPKDSEPEADEQELPTSKDRLSDENLQLLSRDIDGAANSARPGSIKRTSSRRSIVAPSEVESFRSQRSSNTAAHYRYKHLEDANVYIHVDPPEDIQTAIDDIVNAEPSEDRHAIVRDKAQKFWTRCKELVQAAAGKDDFVHVFYAVAEDMSPDSLIFRKKADWRAELKPKIQQSGLNLSFLSDFNVMGSDEQHELDHVSAPPPPPKRHQQLAGCLYVSPHDFLNISSDSPPDNRPFQPEKARDTSPIKTPRPDITTGIKESTLISALASTLSSQHFNYTKAKRFLEELQDMPDMTMRSERDGEPQEPALIIMPTQRKSALALPTLIFEGKGYSTGTQVFEAQDQAAVSGACGVKIQMMLDALVKRVTKRFDVPLTPSKTQPPLVFSICNEGPYHELWAHYTVIKDGERHFNMVLLNTCNGVLLKQVERFFIQIDNVMTWTVGPFLESVVEGLRKAAMKARASSY